MHLFQFISSIMYYGVLSSCMVGSLVGRFFIFKMECFGGFHVSYNVVPSFSLPPRRTISSLSYLFFLLTWHVWSDGLVWLFFSNDHDNSCACICMRPAYGIRHKAETSISVSSISSLPFPMWWVELRLCWCGEFFAFFAFVFILDAMVISYYQHPHVWLTLCFPSFLDPSLEGQCGRRRIGCLYVCSVIVKNKFVYC